jgi:hypothetical protein
MTRRRLSPMIIRRAAQDRYAGRSQALRPFVGRHGTRPNATGRPGEVTQHDQIVSTLPGSSPGEGFATSLSATAPDKTNKNGSRRPVALTVTRRSNTTGDFCRSSATAIATDLRVVASPERQTRGSAKRGRCRLDHPSVICLR